MYHKRNKEYRQTFNNFLIHRKFKEICCFRNSEKLETESENRYYNRSELSSDNRINSILEICTDIVQSQCHDNDAVNCAMEECVSTFGGNQLEDSVKISSVNQTGNYIDNISVNVTINSIDNSSVNQSGNSIDDSSVIHTEEQTKNHFPLNENEVVSDNRQINQDINMLCNPTILSSCKLNSLDANNESYS